jgi:hypothetical protein
MATDSQSKRAKATTPRKTKAPSPQTPAPAPTRASVGKSARALSGRRAALVSQVGDMLFPVQQILNPFSSDETWRNLQLDESTLGRMSAADVITLMTEISPDISRAIWDFLRMCNSGWEKRAVLADRKTLAPQTAQDALNEIVNQIGALYGSIDSIINRLFIGAFVRGAFFAEVVLNKTGKDAIDIVVPDPISARFQQMKDPDRGWVWVLGQWQAGEFVRLDAPTVRYIPIDPLPGSPFGRALISPALFAAMFTIMLLHDLRRVVAQQGYPRLDLEVSLDELLKAMPGDLATDPDAFTDWTRQIIAEIQNVYAGLQPEDAYIHTSVVKVNRPVGTVDSSSLGAIDGIMRALERLSIRALKTMPLLMGVNEGSSETHANRQWEVYAAGIKSIQHVAESLLEEFFGIALRVRGIPALVEFRFAELRAAEMMRDEQTLQLKITNNKAMQDNGWIDQTEASNNVTGHDPALPGPPQPPVVVPPGIPGVDELLAINADPGSQRSVRSLVDELRISRKELVAAIRVLIGDG